MNRRHFLRTTIGGVVTVAAVKVAAAMGLLKDVAAPQTEDRYYDMRGAMVTDDLLRKAEAAQILQQSEQRESRRRAEALSKLDELLHEYGWQRSDFRSDQIERAVQQLYRARERWLRHDPTLKNSPAWIDQLCWEEST